MNNDQIIAHIKDRFYKKKVIKDKRRDVLDEQDSALQAMLPLYNESTNSSGYVSPRSYGTMTRQTFTSVLPFLARNFLFDTKLFPDYIDFTPEVTADNSKRRQVAKGLSDIIGLLRQEGDWEKANNDATEDLIRGECYLYHDLVKNYDQESLEKVKYFHIPWENVYPEYKSKDWIIVSNLTKYDYISQYGEESFEKVGVGCIVNDSDSEDNFSTAGDQKHNEDIVQVVTYINPATKEFYEVHGNGTVENKLTKDKYPFRDDRGRCYAPINRRVFYKATGDNYHGWGVYDFLISLARTETTIINASLQTVIRDADPEIIISTDGDPEDERTRFAQHKANQMRGMSTPFFVRNTNIGSRRDVQNLSSGNTTNLAQNWKDIILDWATIYTRIDFRILIKYAPTAEQQSLRKQEQDKVNRSIIERNALADKEMAMQDIYLLKTRENDFNDLEILMDIVTEDELSPEEIDDLKNSNGELPKEEVTVREVLDMTEDYRYKIEPRLEGAFSDRSFQEVQSMKESYALATPGTVAQEKLFTQLTNSTSPNAKIQYGDNSKPVQQMPQQPLQGSQVPEVDPNAIA